MAKQSLAQEIDEAYVLLYNARHEADILARLRAYRFDETRLEAGLALHGTVVSLFHAYEDRVGDQVGATQAFYEAWETGRQLLGQHRWMGKELFERSGDLFVDLGLGEQHQRRWADWVAQARAFYANLLGDGDGVRAFEGTFGVRRVDLEEAARGVEEMMRLNAVQESAKSRTKVAKQERDERLAELRVLVRRLRRVMKMAGIE